MSSHNHTALSGQSGNGSQVLGAEPPGPSASCCLDFLVCAGGAAAGESHSALGYLRAGRGGGGGGEIESLCSISKANKRSSQTLANKGKFVTATSEEERRFCPSWGGGGAGDAVGLWAEEPSGCYPVDSHCFGRPALTGRKRAEGHYKFVTGTNCFHSCLWLQARSPSTVHGSPLPSSALSLWKPGPGQAAPPGSRQANC